MPSLAFSGNSAATLAIELALAFNPNKQGHFVVQFERGAPPFFVVVAVTSWRLSRRFSVRAVSSARASALK